MVFTTGLRSVLITNIPEQESVSHTVYFYRVSNGL